MNVKKSGLKLGILAKILTVVIVPLIVLTAITVILSIDSMSEGMQTEVVDGLKSLTTSVRSAYEHIDEGSFTVNEADELCKGDYNISANMDLLDDMVEGLDFEVTVFYGDTRYATTLTNSSGQRDIGSKASETVVEKVVTKGEEYHSNSLKIGDANYYAYYMPLHDADGTIVGMTFAGKPSADVDDLIASKARTILFVALGVMIVAIAVAVLILVMLVKRIKVTQKTIMELASGDLSAAVPEKAAENTDEIGEMSRAVNSLTDRLNEIIGDIKAVADSVLSAGNELEEVSAQTSSNADEISHAVEDISSGAISMAEDIESATQQVVMIGDQITEIANVMDRMNDSSTKIAQDGEQSVSIIEDLSKSNDLTIEAIGRIGKQVQATDNSVKEIQEAVSLIASIAGETNLLSLNASIEAARAGEAGKGFAVVASEIQKLAEESNGSAQKIESIIRVLSAESKTSLEVMEEVEQMVETQQQKLNDTKEKFALVNSGIIGSQKETAVVSGMTEECDASRKKVVDVIQNLSAVSEENAASTQETTASMQELNATINQIAEQAGALKELAHALNNDMQFFKTR